MYSRYWHVVFTNSRGFDISATGPVMKLLSMQPPFSTGLYSSASTKLNTWIYLYDPLPDTPPERECTDHI